MGSKSLWLLWSLTFLFLVSGCGGPYVRKDLHNVYKPKIKTVAILPFKNITTNKEAAEAHLALQLPMLYELKKHEMDFTCSIQEVARTDKILADSGISVDSLDAKTPFQLGQILGVDAIMTGTLLKYQEKGKTGQWVSYLLFGNATGAEVVCRISILDCLTQNLLWDWDIHARGGFLTSPESVANEVGKSVAKKWPFKKKK